MSFGDHLEELRRRLIWGFVGPLPIFIICLIFGGPLLEFLVEPASAQLKAAGLPARMLATSPTEPFTAYLKVAMVVTLLFGAPWILYQVWLFVAPGLYSHERRFAYFLFPLSGLLTVTAAVFLYTVMLPVSLRFLILFGSMLIQSPAATAPTPDGTTLGSLPVLRADPVDPAPGSWWINETLNEIRVAVPAPAKGNNSEPTARSVVRGVPLSGGGMIAQEYRIGEYVNLVFALGVVFAVAFQLPVVLLLANWLGLVERAWLEKQRRYAVFILAVVSAMATPADPMSMLFLMLPLMGLFEVAILLMRFVPAGRVAGTPEPSDAGDE